MFSNYTIVLFTLDYAIYLINAYSFNCIQNKNVKLDVKVRVDVLNLIWEKSVLKV